MNKRTIVKHHLSHGMHDLQDQKVLIAKDTATFTRRIILCMISIMLFGGMWWYIYGQWQEIAINASIRNPIQYLGLSGKDKVTFEHILKQFAHKNMTIIPYLRGIEESLGAGCRVHRIEINENHLLKMSSESKSIDDMEAVALWHQQQGCKVHMNQLSRRSDGLYQAELCIEKDKGSVVGKDS